MREEVAGMSGMLGRARGVVRGFVASQVGVVTVEWVALAGAVVVGAIFIGWTLLHSLGTSTAVSNIGCTLSSNCSSP
jgi:hypothetical protein